MRDSLGFALVGCGMIARFHVRAIVEIPGERVNALVSRIPANAQKLIAEANLVDCAVFATVEEAVKALGVDAVV